MSCALSAGCAAPEPAEDPSGVEAVAPQQPAEPDFHGADEGVSADETLERIDSYIADASARDASAAASRPKAPRSLTRGKGDEADRWIALGEAALERGNFEQARQHFRKARRLIPEHPAPVVGIVEARFGRLGLALEFGAAKGDRRVSELLALLREGQRLQPTFAPAQLLEGQLHLALGDAQAAEPLLSAARSALADDAEAHSAWGVARLAQGDKAGALEGFSEAARLDPNNPERLSNLGTAWLMQAEVEQAVVALEKAARLAPTQPRTLGDYGTALLAAGRVDEAIVQLSKAHELAPERATFMSNLCYAYRLRRQAEVARRWCDRAIEKDPKLTSAWINLATIHAANKHYDLAREALEKAKRLDPTDPRVHANLDDLAQLTR